MSALNARSSLLTLSFVPGAGSDFVDAIKGHAKFVDDEFGVKYHVEGRQVETIGEMKSGKWVGYAARALVMRFWDLAKVHFILFETRCSNAYIIMSNRKRTHLISC